jgi:hypothetical protein
MHQSAGGAYALKNRKDKSPKYFKFIEEKKL